MTTPVRGLDRIIAAVNSRRGAPTEWEDVFSFYGEINKGAKEAVEDLSPARGTDPAKTIVELATIVATETDTILQPVISPEDLQAAVDRLGPPFRELTVVAQLGPGVTVQLHREARATLDAAIASGAFGGTDDEEPPAP